MKSTDGIVLDRVRLGVLVSGVDELFRVVAAEMREAGLVDDADEAARALAGREAVQSTALGAGIAIPHARATCCGASRLFAVRLGMALDFGAPDGLPVDLVFVLLGPPGDPAAHVKLLARLARALGKPGVVQALRAAADEDAFRRVLEAEPAAA